jgi:hypothetical protein
MRRREREVNMEEVRKHGNFTLRFDEKSGEWIAFDVERNEVDHDVAYKELLKRLDRRAAHGIEAFSGWRSTIEGLQATKITSVIRGGSGFGYLGAFQCWYSDKVGGKGKVSAELVFLPTDENMPIITEVRELDVQIRALKIKRDEIKQNLRSLRNMVTDKNCKMPLVVKIRNFVDGADSIINVVD